ncbi:transglutaminase domain-containing protein [Candidatus Woesearchaeota archaeon]|nr:transglutaminase domain-containing protein [Candidatus Woesearchaeota archaeon]
MKKRLLLFILLFLSISLSYADDSLLFSKELKLGVDASSKVRVFKEGKYGSLDILKINMTSFPRNTESQDVLELATFPDSEASDSIFFVFNEPAQEDILFSYSAVLKTKEFFPKIEKRISFPLKKIPENMIRYTEPTPNIDSDNEKIIRLGSRLAEGEQDMAVVVFNIAEWIQENVNYSITTLTADSSQKASWVLENRYGVCDEITTLFIALLRSVGIPARYVTGMAYTNMEIFKNDFNNHGWAEVYFPGYGWVPYDVTYKEYGYVDSSHIIMMRSDDSAPSSTKYSWIGNDVEIKTSDINTKVRIIEKGKGIDSLLKISAEPVNNEVSFGSYNLIQARILNQNAFYVSEEFSISRSDGAIISSSRNTRLILAPGEEKNVFWLLKVNNLDEDFIYTFPILIYTSRNETATTEFKASRYGSFLDKEELVQFMESEKQAEKSYSKQLDIECVSSKKQVYVAEYSEINCSIKNAGNAYLSNINVCLEQCQTVSLGISQEKGLVFSYVPVEPGFKTLFIKANSDDVSKTEKVIMDVLDFPKVNITLVEYPDNISFGQKYSVKFSLLRDSYSVPKNLEIELKSGRLLKSWSIDNLSERRNFILNLDSGSFERTNESFNIRIIYNDDGGRDYQQVSDFIITLNKPTLMQELRMLNNRLNSSIALGNGAYLVISIALALFFFGVVSGIILKKNRK